MFKQNAWNNYSEETKKDVFALAEDYKDFIAEAKIEREFTSNSIPLLEKAGFKLFKTSDKLKAGDKVYSINKNKNVLAFIIGKKPLEEGLRILGAHIDSPRIDIKQNPLYESGEFALFDTHYYGGIKKYQWTTVPLCLMGVVVKKDGTSVKINIGNKKEDPIFGISDLLVHLAADQMTKPAGKVVEGENLDITIGNMPLKGSDKNPVKANILKILKDTYGIDEEDFLSAEIEAVPALEPRDYGLDRSMIAAYGHDDKCCAYTSLRAILDIKGIPEYTSCCILVDKEEIGSVGATGAQSTFFEDTVADVLVSCGNSNINAIRHCLTNSKMLSSDVSAGFDPLYAGVFEEKNSCYLSKGVVFNKYTGARGKSGCNDANPEYLAWLRSILDDANIDYQTSELGKVDVGGGGTIAYILGNKNMNVVDAGIAVLNMHSPMEIISKADLYETYRCYVAFLEAK
jgi:aspartyl aminopeptidase